MLLLPARAGINWPGCLHGGSSGGRPAVGKGSAVIAGLPGATCAHPHPVVGAPTPLQCFTEVITTCACPQYTRPELASLPGVAVADLARRARGCCCPAETCRYHKCRGGTGADIALSLLGRRGKTLRKLCVLINCYFWSVVAIGLHQSLLLPGREIRTLMSATSCQIG